MPDYEIDTRVLDRIIRQYPGQADDWLRGVAQQIMNEVVLSFGSGPGGAVYTRGSVMHTASRPGNAPNIDTGALRASMHFERTGTLEYTISDGVEYGIHLEEGTPTMGARPFMQPVFSEWQNKIERDAAQFGLFDL